MEDFFLLQDSHLADYAHMIPDGWKEQTWETAAVQLWGAAYLGMPCGAAVVSSELGTLWLHHIYIAADFRGRGIGLRFLTELMLQAYRDGKKYLRLRCMQGAYQELERLLMAYPFTHQEENIGSFSCTLGQLLQNPYFRGKYREIQPLSKCSEASLRPLYQKIQQQEENIAGFPLHKKEYLADVCSVKLEQDKPAGILLIRAEAAGAVRIEYLLNYASDVTAPIEMLCFAVQRGSRLYPPETICHFDIVNETLFRIVEKMGLTPAARKRCYTMELSYFARHETKVKNYLFGKSDRI